MKMPKCSECRFNKDKCEFVSVQKKQKGKRICKVCELLNRSTIYLPLISSDPIYERVFPIVDNTLAIQMSHEVFNNSGLAGFCLNGLLHEAKIEGFKLWICQKLYIGSSQHKIYPCIICLYKDKFYVDATYHNQENTTDIKKYIKWDSKNEFVKTPAFSLNVLYTWLTDSMTAILCGKSNVLEAAIHAMGYEHFHYFANADKVLHDLDDASKKNDVGIPPRDALKNMIIQQYNVYCRYGCEDFGRIFVLRSIVLLREVIRDGVITDFSKSTNDNPSLPIPEEK